MLKNKKNNYFIFIFSVLVILSSGANPAFAAMEVNLPGLSDNATLSQYAAYIFDTLIGLAGGLALISFVIGAVTLIMSGDSAEASSNAKDRMKGAILGLVLTLASFLIIDKINPSLEKLNMTKLPEVVIPVPAVESGIYFFSEAGCTGDSSGAVTSSQNNLEGLVDAGIKSLKIVNDPVNKIDYGIILHENVGLNSGGKCSQPITSEGCQSINIDPEAADIFEMNKENPGGAGDGVSFYSEPYGWDSGADAGFYNVDNDEIDSPSYQASPEKMCFSYTGVKEPEAYQHKCAGGTCGNFSGSEGDTTGDEGVDCSTDACETFKDCPGSIDIKGSYLVAVYSKDSKSGSSDANYCQTFNGQTRDVEDMDTEPVVAAGGNEISKIIIIPIK